MPRHDLQQYPHLVMQVPGTGNHLWDTQRTFGTQVTLSQGLDVPSRGLFHLFRAFLLQNLGGEGGATSHKLHTISEKRGKLCTRHENQRPAGWCPAGWRKASTLGTGQLSAEMA